MTDDLGPTARRVIHETLGRPCQPTVHDRFAHQGCTGFAEGLSHDFCHCQCHGPGLKTRAERALAFAEHVSQLDQPGGGRPPVTVAEVAAAARQILHPHA